MGREGPFPLTAGARPAAKYPAAFLPQPPESIPFECVPEEMVESPPAMPPEECEYSHDDPWEGGPAQGEDDFIADKEAAFDLWGDNADL